MSMSSGVITKRAIEGMSVSHKQILQRNLHLLALAPAEPICIHMAASVKNYYSEDYVTGFGPFGYAKRYLKNPNYDIRIEKCISSRSERTLWIADHGFLMPTYKKAWEGHIDDLKLDFNFYGGSKNVKTR